MEREQRVTVHADVTRCTKVWGDHFPPPKVLRGEAYLPKVLRALRPGEGSLRKPPAFFCGVRPPHRCCPRRMLHEALSYPSIRPSIHQRTEMREQRTERIALACLLAGVRGADSPPQGVEAGGGSRINRKVSPPGGSRIKRKVSPPACSPPCPPLLSESSQS